MLFQCGEGCLHLLCDALHARDGGVAVLFVDVVELDARDVVVLADGEGGFGDVSAQTVVEEIDDTRLGILLKGIAEQTGEGGTVGVEVDTIEVVIAIFADFDARPAVVGAAEDEQDIR